VTLLDYRLEPKLSASLEYEPNHEFTIRRADGSDIGGDYSYMSCDGPDDWMVAEESEHDDPTEYVIEKWVGVGQWRRTFGEPIADED
jgi:hypothetical protein